MNCPFCNNVDTKVLDSRPEIGGKAIRRRRECISCMKRWRTMERVEDEMPLVMKKNGTHQPFDHEKLFTAVKISCGKRPVTNAQMEKLVADVEWTILESGAKMVASEEIGLKVMLALRDIDEISYLRYASVYRRFKDVREMMIEIEKLLKDHTSEVVTAEKKTVGQNASA